MIIFIIIIFIIIIFQNGTLTGGVNGKLLFNITVPSKPSSGFIGVGTDSYGIADFDNLRVTSATDGELLLEEKITKRKYLEKSKSSWWKPTENSIKLGKKRRNRNGVVDDEVVDDKLYFIAKRPQIAQYVTLTVADLENKKGGVLDWDGVNWPVVEWSRELKSKMSL